MKLKDARLCVECDEVYEGFAVTDINKVSSERMFQCPSCGSLSSLPVSQWLPTMNSLERSKSLKEFRWNGKNVKVSEGGKQL